MKCEKSYKRNMLTVWGMKELGKGRSLSDVKADMAKWMKKTVSEIKEMVSMNREAKIAKQIVGSGPDEAYMFASQLGKVRGVVSSTVNDYAVLSHNPTVYEVDIFVYVDPVMGGTLTNTIKAAVNRIGKMLGVRVKGFWSPRADRDISEVGLQGLRDFYRQNPYKITVYAYGDE